MGEEAILEMESKEEMRRQAMLRQGSEEYLAGASMLHVREREEPEEEIGEVIEEEVTDPAIIEELMREFEQAKDESEPPSEMSEMSEEDMYLSEQEEHQNPRIIPMKIRSLPN